MKSVRKTLSSFGQWHGTLDCDVFWNFLDDQQALSPASPRFLVAQKIFLGLSECVRREEQEDEMDRQQDSGGTAHAGAC